MLIEETSLTQDLQSRGFSTIPFPDDLRLEMLHHIDSYIKVLGYPHSSAEDIESLGMAVPDEIWSKKMSRAYRIFPELLAQKIAIWADETVRTGVGRTRSAVNVVYPEETQANETLSEDNLAIYWRCVRPGKPDAGRAHRDAQFWELEFSVGYDPKIPFAFDYQRDCLKIWIPLRGCTPQTTLQVIPGSHKLEVEMFFTETEYGRRPALTDTWLEKHRHDFMSPPELSQGSCIVFDMNTVHRGPTHNNSQLRISAELNLLLN